MDKKTIFCKFSYLGAHVLTPF